MQGAQLFEDLRQREQQALEINDNVLQGLVVAKMALDLDQPDKANDALDRRHRVSEQDDHRAARATTTSRSTCSAARRRLADATSNKDSDPPAPPEHPR